MIKWRDFQNLKPPNFKLELNTKINIFISLKYASKNQHHCKVHNIKLIQEKSSRFNSPTRIAEELPLLAQLIAKMPKLDFSKFNFLFIQHFLAAFPARLDLMLKDGLDPKHTWFLDIPYSTNREVSDRINNNFPGRIPEPYTDPFGQYNIDQLKRLSKVVDSIMKNGGGGPLVVVDDGAYFAKYLANLLISDPQKAKYFTGTQIVEQTTRGHRFLESEKGIKTIKELKLKAVSVARAETKIHFEAPFIGVALAKSIIEDLKAKKIIPKHTLILGFGSVGSSTAFEIQSKFPTSTIDILEVEKEKLLWAEEMGFAVHKKLPQEAPSHLFDLVVGCTGKRTFTPSDRKLLDDKALLASGSSAAVEFDRKNFVDQADMIKDDDFEVLTPRELPNKLHTDIMFRHSPENKTFTIMNSGFPMNFKGTLGFIPSELIEPTHCLLHAATHEVIGSSQPGLKNLNKKSDKDIHKMAKSLIE